MFDMIHLPIACGATRWVNPTEKQRNSKVYDIHAIYCSPNENDNSSNNQNFAEKEKRKIYIKA